MNILKKDFWAAVQMFKGPPKILGVKYFKSLELPHVVPDFLIYSLQC